MSSCNCPIHIYIYNIHIGGWGEERSGPTGKSASFRSCVRARGLVVRWEWRSKSAAAFSLFPFVSPRPSLFPSGAKVSPNEFK